MKGPPSPKPGPRPATTADARKDQPSLIRMGSSNMSAGVRTGPSGLQSRARTTGRSLIGGSS